MISRSSANSSAHRWKFFRTGGFDQVALETGADLLNLEHLDQKLWVALSCPVKGTELDERTLALIDQDNDERIRVPELITAVKWAAARLKDPAELLRGADALPLTSINDTTPEGKLLVSAAKQVLANLGRATEPTIHVSQSSDIAHIFAVNPINGDGVIPPEAAEDEETRALIKDIMACIGTTADRTGLAGVSAKQVDAFYQDLGAYIAWANEGAAPGIAVLGEATGAAYDAFQALRAKVDDYFARCRLAAFDLRAINALNRSETDYLNVAAKDMKITADEVSGFPLATIAANKPLPLFEALNPAWAAAVDKLRRTAIGPILGAEKKTLTEAEWLDISGRLAPYDKWRSQKPASACEKLGLARAKQISESRARYTLAGLFARDQALAPEFQSIGEVDRLVRYYRDLRTLLHNFVNFADLYSQDRYAVFQAGTLYLDSRSTELCIRVDGPSPLAAMSKAYIAYCACTRAGSQAIIIGACFTQGDSDYLFVGRRGVFYDRQGRDWDAVITSIIENPISIRQAFWSPYKKFIRFIEEQVAKRAAAAETASTTRLSSAAERTVQADRAKAPAEPPRKFDLALITGIGVALGSIGGFLAAVFTNFVNLGFWMPVGIIGIMLAISTPSMVIAWLKLRQRTLGPILEANGWAVNGRVKINIPFGTKLTEVAKLPAGAKRSLDDPYEDKDAKRHKWQSIFVLIVAILIGAAAVIRWDHNRRGRYFWESESKTPPKENSQTVR